MAVHLISGNQATQTLLELTSGEAGILRIIQERYGSQNNVDDVFFTDADEGRHTRQGVIGTRTPNSSAVAQPHINKALTSVRCASFNLPVGASEREQLFALGMPCTGTTRGRFFWGLDSAACPCSRKFCVAIVDVRKRKFQCVPCDPRVECRRAGALSNRVFPLDIGFHFHCALHEPCGGTQGVVPQRLYCIESNGAELAA